MENLQVVINHYGRPDLLGRTLDSVREHLPETPVHVADGRYAHFDPDGDGDLTPGSRDLCRDYENVHYHVPPDDLLPFGEERPEGRYPMHVAAEWLWYEVADASTWALKIDDDELLRRFDLDEDDLDGLDRTLKYQATLRMGRRDEVNNARLWVPEEWTFYVDDICYPREQVQRGESFEDLREKCRPHYSWNNVGKALERVKIRNLGHERDESWTTEREKVKDEIRENAV